LAAVATSTECQESVEKPSQIRVLLENEYNRGID
jgi:hypothetical protein